MLSIMAAQREPDMSLPTAVQGVSLSTVIIPPPDPDMTRLAAMRKDRADKVRAEQAVNSARWSLVKTLSHCEVDGQSVASSLEYWQQPHDSLVCRDTLRHKEAFNTEPFSYEPVTHDGIPPQYKVSVDGA